MFLADAVTQNGYTINHIPKELITDELCKIAVTQNEYTIQYILKEFITDELCKIAVTQDGYAIYYIPERSFAIWTS